MRAGTNHVPNVESKNGADGCDNVVLFYHARRATFNLASKIPLGPEQERLDREREHENLAPYLHLRLMPVVFNLGVTKSIPMCILEYQDMPLRSESHDI